MTPTFAFARVRDWPTRYQPAGPVNGVLRIPPVVDELQKARNGAAVWVLAGDLNVQRGVLASGFGRPPFPPSPGFTVVSGGLDHIIACHGAEQVRVDKQRPGRQIGDHAPLGGVVTCPRPSPARAARSE